MEYHWHAITDPLLRESQGRIICKIVTTFAQVLEMSNELSNFCMALLTAEAIHLACSQCAITVIKQGPEVLHWEASTA